MSDSTLIFNRLLEIAALLQQDLTRSFEGTALTASRTHLLWEVHHRGPTTQQVLAGALDVSPRNITGLVDALEAAGYVERRPHPHDRRAAMVTLTDLGAETMARMTHEHQQIADLLVDGLSSRETTELGDRLGVITDRLRAVIIASGSAR